MTSRLYEPSGRGGRPPSDKFGDKAQAAFFESKDRKPFAEISREYLISSALRENRRRRPCELIRAADAVNLDMEKSSNNVVTLQATSARLRREDKGVIEAVLAQFIEPEDPEKRTMHRHLGEEAILVVSGSIQVEYFTGRTLTLSQGECVWLRSEAYHEVIPLTPNARAVVAWWSPWFKSSMLQGVPGSGGDEDSFERRRERGTAFHSISLAVVGQDEVRAQYLKHCYGMTDLIQHRLSKLGLDDTVLQTWLGRGERSIFEMLYGSLDISLGEHGTLSTLASRLQLPNFARLIWRIDDADKEWIHHVPQDAKPKGNLLPKHAVMRLEREKLSNRKGKIFRAGSGTDRIFVPLGEQDDNRHGIRLRSLEGAGIRLNATPGGAIFVPAGLGDYQLLSDMDSADCYVLSIDGEIEAKLNKSIDNNHAVD